MSVTLAVRPVARPADASTPEDPASAGDVARVVHVDLRGGVDTSETSLRECREHVARLVESHGCTAVAFDLAGLPVAPSSVLGLIAAAVRLGVEVHALNPSPRVREVLRTTRLDRLVRVHDDGDLTPSTPHPPAACSDSGPPRRA